jgi:Xaa-Pro aminopeptidase
LTSSGSARLESLQRALASQDAGALLVLAESAADPDLQPFVGSSHLGASWLLVSGARSFLAYATAMEREEAQRTGIELATPEALGLSGWAERLGRDTPAFWSRWVAEGLLRLAPRAESRILIAGHPPAGVVVELCRDLLAAGLLPEPGHSLVRWVRRQKTSQELQEIRRVAGAVGEAFRGVAHLLADASETAGQLWSGGRPLTAGVLRGVIAEALSREQLEQPKGNIVACGRDGGVPHNQGDDERILRAGESIVVDLFPRGRLFADATRTFCVGDPSEALRAAHAAVEEARRRACRSVRAGAVGWDLQRAACGLFAERGYTTLLDDPEATRGYVHGLGHGVGLELHEDPSFRARAEERGIFIAGDVVTVEPGLYDPGAEGHGVRIEDLLVVETEGAEVLTEWPRGLDPRAWRNLEGEGGR